ncbi:thioesterase family protein [Halorubellus sp. PRR65]|uniref:acyl-CoA thioesterase n=1 Tax=Halorubellus sp. PRR65 TaxID=3098148 RepID=UPI002B2631AC|nr:thioesterase family protein [Halorubellus sp. PRR65]
MTDDVYAVDVPVRYQDVDALGHVNNAIYATYLEEARVQYLPDVLGDTGAIEAVLANLEIDYRRPVTLEDGFVTVEIEVVDVGTKSMTFEYDVYASGELAADASTVQVAYDGETTESVEIPEAWRQTLREFEGLD